MSRLTLHERLLKVTNLGSDRVYFQPPDKNTKMSYPCVIYSLSSVSPFFADNHTQVRYKGYQVIYVTKDPDSDIIEKMDDGFTYCRFDRYYSADNLHHFVFTIYDNFN